MNAVWGSVISNTQESYIIIAGEGGIQGGGDFNAGNAVL